MRIEMTRPAADPQRISGHVVLPDGSPAAGAFVSTGAIAMETDELGRFTLDTGHPAYNLPGLTGALTLRAVLPGFAPAHYALPSLSEGQASGWPAAIVLELGALTELLTIAGRVVDENDEPLEGVLVHLLDRTSFGQVPSEPGGQYYHQTTLEELVSGADARVPTDAHGNFEFKGLVDHAYRLEATERATMASSLTKPIEAGADDVVIRLDRSTLGVVAGKVVGPDGAGLAGVHVSVIKTIEGFGFVNGSAAVSDEDGSFTIEESATDGILLSLVGEEIVPEYKRPIPEDADLEKLELLVGRRCHIQIDWSNWPAYTTEVRVEDARGQPLKLVVMRGNMVAPRERAAVAGELSEVFAVSELAKTLVIMQDGAEVERVPMSLAPGDVQRVDI
jgi:hypothetical protein